MQTQWNIRKVLSWTEQDFRDKEIATPRLDAEILISKALDIDRVGLYLDLDRPLSKQELESVHALVSRRRKREPVAYILNEKEFYGKPFIVNPNVLIPRPETEILVDQLLAKYKDCTSPLSGLDLCTGSGVVGLSIACQMRNVQMDLSDLSKEALEVAQLNGQVLGLTEQIQFYQGDLFSSVSVENGAQTKQDHYDFITANPPYISNHVLQKLQPEIQKFEPALALDGGHDGLEILRTLIADAHLFLKSEGTLWIEIGSDQKDSVISLFESSGFYNNVRVFEDYSRLPRVAFAQKI